MPFGYVIRHIIALINITSIFEELCDNNVIRESWSWKRPSLPNIYDYINYDDDLRACCHIEMHTFQYVFEETEPFMDWPRDWYKKVDDVSIKEYKGKKQSSALSNKDRLLRAFMFAAKKCVNGLQELFNQGKSIIYADFKFVSMQIVKAMGMYEYIYMYGYIFVCFVIY